MVFSNKTIPLLNSSGAAAALVAFPPPGFVGQVNIHHWTEIQPEK
jgi:hypothetical protein